MGPTDAIATRSQAGSCILATLRNIVAAARELLVSFDPE
jgi:hypothetical protein